MINKINNLKFNPDYAVCPGITMLEFLEHIGMTQAELAERTGRPKKTINEIIKGKQGITPETAIQFERVLGMSASFWNNLEKNYREILARIREEKVLEKQLEWLNKIPVDHMIEYEWIKKHEDPVNQLQEVLSFFGVANVEKLENQCTEVIFRQSKKTKSDPWAVCAWLRKGELEGKDIQCNVYNKEKFTAALMEIREMTARKITDILDNWQRICAESGVAVTIVREFPKMRVNGATRWLSKDKALIQLSILYKYVDILWFTFFHEAGHILLHGKKDLFIENGMKGGDDKEAHADKFAQNFLIPEQDYNVFLKSGNFSHIAVAEFAKKIKIAPGIVVGRLQHDNVIPFSQLNYLKPRLKWQ